MCGIFGGILSQSGYKDQDFLNCLAHRGPDSQKTLSVGTIKVGHSLLAIRSDSALNSQPLEIDGRWTIAFNGEIYRSPDKFLNEKLQSDVSSELCVLERLIHSYGNNFLSHIRGMFAIVIVDKIEKTITFARDGSGQKPLFYRLSGGHLSHWASELSALLKISECTFELNTQYLFQNIPYGFAKTDSTIAQDIFQLPPNTFMTFNFSGVLQGHGNIITFGKSLRSLELPELLEEVFLTHLLTNKKAALSLSGGLDSGTLAALATKHSVSWEMFSTRFIDCPEEYNWDFWRAQRLSEDLGQNFNPVEITPKSYLQNIELSHSLLDDPVYNQSVPVYLQLISSVKDNYPEIRVLYSGAGGDELFAGYEHDQRYIRQTLISCTFGTKLYELLYGLKNGHKPNLNPKEFWRQYRSLRIPDGIFTFEIFRNTEQVADQKRENLSQREKVNMLLNENFDWLRSDNLQYLDRYCMYRQIEGRSPFCDFELINWCRETITPLQLLKIRSEKRPLTRAVSGLLPEWYFQDIEKKGWSAPIKHWYESIPEFRFYFREFFAHAEDSLNLEFIDWTKLQSYLRPGMPYPGKWIIYLYSVVVNLRKLGSLS